MLILNCEDLALLLSVILKCGDPVQITDFHQMI